MGNVVSKMHVISNSAQKVGDIINVIDSIAFQTIEGRGGGCLLSW